MILDFDRRHILVRYSFHSFSDSARVSKFSKSHSFFVSYPMFMFLGSKMGYLGMPNAMAQVRGLSAHSVALYSPKSCFLGHYFNVSAFFNHTLSIVVLLGYHLMSREELKGPGDSF